MALPKLPEKVIQKWLKENLELHKRLLTTYLHQRGLKLLARGRFFRLYDMYIDETNILDVLNIPICIFVRALALNQLEDVRSAIQTPSSEKILPRNQRKRKTKKCLN